jgi:tetratricopeptide (TPR) repeat protein
VLRRLRLSDLALGLDLNEENIYTGSEPFTRQEIFATESFSSIQFLTGENRNDDVTKHLRLLGRFYGGKVLSDKEKALPSDFERALYYFHLALKKSPRSYAVLNDYGWLFSFVANPKQFELAKSYFRASLEANPAQHRALYNLGTIAMTTRTHLQQGLDDLRGCGATNQMGRV